MPPSFSDPRIEGVLAAYPFRLRRNLLRIRDLIFAVAEDADVGGLIETLKWGQPAYMPARPRTGTTVRIDAFGDLDHYAVFFHCRTGLVSTFRTLYPEAFIFHGERAIILSVGSSLPENPLKHCISLALTYHLTSQRSPRRPHSRR